MSRFVSVPITQTMIDKARAMCTGEEFNQHTEREDGGGQFVGNIGELAFKKWLDHYFFEHDYVASEMMFYDFVVADRKIDVKAKERTVEPREEYHAAVETRIKDEGCHHYVMVSVQIPSGETNPKSIHLLGWLPKPVFWRLPKDTDNKKDNMPSHKILHSRLRPMSELKDAIETVLYKKAFGEA